MRWLQNLLGRGDPGRDAFARLMIDAIRRTGGPAEVTYDASAFALRGAGDSHDRLNLYNAYNDYLATSGRRARSVVLDRYAQLMLHPEEDATYEAARPHLLPRITNRFYHHEARLLVRLQGEARDDEFLTRPFTPDLSIDLVRDYPDRLLNIGASQLREWGVTFEQAMAAATENLWERSKKDFVEVAPGLYQSVWEDALGATRLCLPGLIWQLKVAGRHVAMIPNRDVLLVTGSDDADALLQMAAIADRVLQEPRSLSGVAVQLGDDNAWKTFMPPPDSSAFEPLRRAAIRSMASDYATQHDLLDQFHERDRTDVFVAKLDVIRHPATDAWKTWAVWVDGVTDALLPQADLIAFGWLDEATGKPAQHWVQWERLHDVVGHLMEPTDFYPVRYRVRTFPSEDQLRQMGAGPEPW